MTNASRTVARDTRVGAILDEYLRDLEAGRTPDRDALLAQHPDVVEELAAAFRGLDLVRGAVPSLRPGEEPADAQAGLSLGDYRLVREVGRGGMAVVYEAEQLSLRRRVALKVLPFAAVLDSKQIQRFKNEALAAATLHHPNIVPVHGVGCERGVHYYAMQYVDGQSLAVAIRDMRSGSAGEGPRTPISSHGSNRDRGYVRMAAELGVQAAQALDHAHQLGIVHRDVKPGNCLVDPSGRLWIADFGLARSLHDVGLTVTGEMLGTVRYMSPEQALAKRSPIDHRTDVYSLGATLYELFTLEPAFPGDDPHRVVLDIATKEPVPPRRLNPALPRDLETVLLKAMSKDPGSRYATAQEMADDLARYLEDTPVSARRPSAAARGARWARRHRGPVAAGLSILVVGALALAAGARREAQNTRAALARAQANLDLAGRAVDDVLVQVGLWRLQDDEGLAPRNRALMERALDLYSALLSEREDYRVHINRSKILDALGRSREALSAADRAVQICPTLAAAHNARGMVLDHLGHLEEAVSALDRAITLDPATHAAYLNLARVLGEMGRLEEGLATLDRATAIHRHSALAHHGRGRTLHRLERYEEALDAYDRSLAIDSGPPGPHYDRGRALEALKRPQEALLAYGRALAIDPTYVVACLGRGLLLREMGRAEEAVAAFERAIEIDQNCASAHHERGRLLGEAGRHGEALASYDRAITLDPQNPLVYANRGAVLQWLGSLPEALAAFDRAIDLQASCGPEQDRGAIVGVGCRRDFAACACRIVEVDPIRTKASTYANRGTVLEALGRHEDAVADYDRAIDLDPSTTNVHYNRGKALGAIGDHEGAIAAYVEAIRRRQCEAEAHCNIGCELFIQGRFGEAVPWYRRGHELGSERPSWPHPSREWLEGAERMAAIEERLERVISGGESALGAGERTDFGEILHAKRRHAEAAQMYRAAFAEDAALAEDLARGHRYNAACAAARAAVAGGTDAARWRGQALEWLRADLVARVEAATGLAETLAHWKRDPDLASVRDRADELPEEERKGWRTLWADVDVAQTRAPTK